MRRADLGLVVLLFLCLYVAFLYFDTTLPINAPNKVIDQMAYLAASLFFLYETRLSLGRERWRAYIAFGFIAAMLLAYSSIPTLIVYFIDGRVLSNSIYESALSFALFIFATAKIMLTTTLVEDVESPVVTKIIAASKSRSEEISRERADTEEKEEPEAEDEDNNQISITDIGVSILSDSADPDRISEDTIDKIESMSMTEDTAVPDTFNSEDECTKEEKEEEPEAQ